MELLIQYHGDKPDRFRDIFQLHRNATRVQHLAATCMTKIFNAVWISLGFISTGIGLLGLLIPLFPGIVFLLIAAFCFSSGSQRWHDWLLAHPRLRPPIVNWRDNDAITLNTKGLVLVMLALSVVAAAVLQIPAHIMAAQVCLILAAAYFVWTRPSV